MPSAKTGPKKTAKKRAKATATTTSKALAVTHEIPSPAVVVAERLVDACEQLAKQAEAFEAITAENLDDASGVVRAIARQEKAVEEARKAAKSPAITFGREVDAIAKRAKTPLEKAKRGLGKKIAEHQDAVERERQAAIKAANERTRNEVDHAARERAEMAAVFGADGDGEQLPDVDLPPVVIPEKVSGTGVSTRKVAKVYLDDEDAIPLVVAGRRLWKQVDKAAIAELHRVGVVVPGTRVVYEDSVTVRG